jgi:putative DNA primase/helicase
LLAWAADLVRRAASYVEVTPSGCGLRILGRVTEDFPPTHTKRKHDGGGEFEIYANLATARYITVTGDRLPGVPDRLAPLDDLARELLQSDAAPPAPSARTSPNHAFDLPAELRARIADPAAADRSGAFQSIVNSLHLLGVSEADALAIFEAHPNGPACKYIEGGRLAAELGRSWDKAATGVPALADPGDAAELDRLAALSPLDYERARVAVAERFAVRVSVLDKEVARRRPAAPPDDTGEDDFQPPDLWPEPVDGAEVAETIRAALLAHVVFQSPTHADAATLWILGTYLMGVWSLWPKLLLKSPEKRCGKTTMLEVIEAHVCAPMMTANITAAALFRSIEKWRPTLIIDEADRFLTANEEANGIINAGHTRRAAFVMRVVERNGEYEPVRFSVWGAQVVACIGAQMDTLEDRSILIGLRRKLSSERVEGVPRKLFEMRAPLRRKAARWALDNAAAIEADDREPPDCGNDRARDNWGPLWAIAAALGGPWPERAVTAYAEMEQRENVEDNDSEGVMLLRDLWEIFGAASADRIASASILSELLTMEDRPWNEFRFGRPLTAAGLAKLMKPFNVRVNKHRFGAGTQRGYAKRDVEEAFRRYCCDPSGTLEQ